MLTTLRKRSPDNEVHLICNRWGFKTSNKYFDWICDNKCIVYLKDLFVVVNQGKFPYETQMIVCGAFGVWPASIPSFPFSIRIRNNFERDLVHACTAS